MDISAFVAFVRGSSDQEITIDSDVQIDQGISIKNVPDHRRDVVVAKCLRDMQFRLTTPRIKGSLGQAVWLPQIRKSKITKTKKGATPKGDNYLSPEETVAAIEFEELQILFHDLPLSIEQAYDLCFETSEEIDFFLVYKELKRLGYAVTKSNLKTSDVKGHPYEGPPAKKFRSEEPTTTSKILNFDIDSTVNYLTLDMVRHRENVVPPVLDFIKQNATTWSEYKLMECHSNPSFQGLAVDLRSSDCDSKLAGKFLSEKGTSVICPPNQISTLGEVMTKLQSCGPKEHHFEVGAQNSRPILIFQGHGEKGTVIVIRESDGLANLQDMLLGIDSNLFFALVSNSGSVKFLRLTPFKIWEEHPSLWLEHVND